MEFLSAASVFSKAKVVFLAMKPQMFDQFLLDSKGENAIPSKSVLFVSIMAGTTVSTLEQVIDYKTWKTHIPIEEVSARSS